MGGRHTPPSSPAKAGDPAKPNKREKAASGIVVIFLGWMPRLRGA
jgi:hypothetical protein